MDGVTQCVIGQSIERITSIFLMWFIPLQDWWNSGTHRSDYSIQYYFLAVFIISIRWSEKESKVLSDRKILNFTQALIRGREMMKRNRRKADNIVLMVLTPSRLSLHVICWTSSGWIHVARVAPLGFVLMCCSQHDIIRWLHSWNM